VEKSVDEVKRPDATGRLVARYSSLLERNFRSGMGVADFASALGVTPTHLTRCCKQACGKPASALLHDRLIFEARTMLAETRIPVGQIAGALGFASPAYFTRAFQHKTGKSPSAFRKEV
jgi:AraC-like DNA-binding protein